METPILYKPTPEGAKDYIVPSRLHPQSVYALPQSPQTLKQLIMMAGFDRYYQIAKCFRDEDLRRDRQPEFTQIDIEASFVTTSSIKDLALQLCRTIWNNPSLNFIDLTFHQAMALYGCDKPDLRFGLPLTNLTDTFSHTSIPFLQELFQSSSSQTPTVLGISVPAKVFLLSRKILDALALALKKSPLFTKNTHFFYVKVESSQPTQPKGGVAKWLTSQNIQEISSSIASTLLTVKDILQNTQISLCESLQHHGADATYLFIAHPEAAKGQALGSLLRTEIASQAKLIDAHSYVFAWIHSFPLFEWDEEQQKLNAMHHPFTLPTDTEAFLALSPTDHSALNLSAHAFDVVCNGYEIAGGSLRISCPQLQKHMFSLLGLSPDDMNHQFGFFLEALRYGAPPHGGIAMGWESHYDAPHKILISERCDSFPQNHTSRMLNVWCACCMGYRISQRVRPTRAIIIGQQSHMIFCKKSLLCPYFALEEEQENDFRGQGHSL